MGIRVSLIVLIVLVLTSAGAWAAQTGTPSSASYAITVGVFETAAVTASSTSYTMVGKTRDREIADPFRKSALYKLLEGFFLSIFKPTAFGPDIDTVSSPFGYNDRTVRLTIGGNEFTGTTTVELSRGGETVLGSIVSVTDTTILCDFDLRGATTATNWDVVVIRSDGLSDTEPNWEIRSPGLEITGTPLNYPNPFDPRKRQTEIRYTLTEDAEITIYIFNILAERVATFKFAAGQVEGGPQGENKVYWSGFSPFGGLLPSGVYICQITSKGRILGTVKIAILK